MTFRILILTGFISALFSCNSNSSSHTILVKADTTVKNLNTATNIQFGTQTNNKEQYANIVRIFQIRGKTFIDADYIQYLTGDAAIEAANKTHQADTFQTEDGKTHIGVPGDYFIVNESKKTRQFALASDCIFELDINPDRLHPIADNSLKSLKAIHNDSPFVLTLNDNGVVVKITEVFLP